MSVEKAMKMRAIKIRISRIVRFCCMVVVLGMQTLLQGSWTVSKIEPLRTDNTLP